MAYDTILVDRADGVGIITMNRPRVLNAMSVALTRELHDALVEIDRDDAVKAVVVTGAGDRAFSAGADVKEMAVLSPAQDAEQEEQSSRWDRYLATYRKPTIGAVNGLAYGGGALLATMLDVRIGCERSRFRYVGAVYGRLNATWILPLVVGWARAKDLLLTARVVEAEEAYRIGLLNDLVPADQVMPRAIEIARMSAANHTESVQGIKALLHEQVGMGYAEMFDHEAEARRERFIPRPIHEGFKDFLDSRKRV